MSDAFSPVPSAELSSLAPPEMSPPPALAERKIRLWPAITLIVVEWLLIFVPVWIEAEVMVQFMARLWGPMVIMLALVGWWLLLSRIRWTDRFLGLVAIAVAAGVTYPFWDVTLADPQSKGFMQLGLYVLPTVSTAWIAWLALTPFLRWPVRRIGMVLVFFLSWGIFPLLRFDGVDGAFAAAFSFRWQPTAEQRYLAEVAAGESTAVPADDKPLTLQPGDWPGFRGPDRDARVSGVQLATDWKEHPPKKIWRHLIGPGWSSFAVIGHRAFTQEQRADDEVVVCYDADSGKQVWAHKDEVRFSDNVSGAGPRGTPTFHDGKIYALGAKGQLNCLEAATGRLIWTQNVMEDSKAKLPIWGFSASPLIASGIVTVFAGGPDGKAVLGYDAVTGKLAWSAGEGNHSYCSTQLSHLGGDEQVLVSSDVGMSAFEPKKGTVLWQYDWRLKEGMNRVTQPCVIDANDVLIGTGFNNGTRRVHVSKDGSTWATKEVSESKAINPYFNDLVVHKGHIYGFEGAFLTCVSLETGKAKWKARGYGNGQLLLLTDQDLLLVLTEKGAVALVDAKPEAHHELTRFQAIEGKTWNHPVLAHGRLYVRNGEEAACYELPGQSPKPVALNFKNSGINRLH